MFYINPRRSAKRSCVERPPHRPAGSSGVADSSANCCFLGEGDFTRRLEKCVRATRAGVLRRVRCGSRRRPIQTNNTNLSLRCKPVPPLSLAHSHQLLAPARRHYLTSPRLPRPHLTSPHCSFHSAPKVTDQHVENDPAIPFNRHARRTAARCEPCRQQSTPLVRHATAKPRRCRRLARCLLAVSRIQHTTQ